MAAPQKGSLVGTSIGKYRISRHLKHGSVGEVYEVIQDSIGYRAAVKILAAQLAEDPGHQQYVARFVDEARAVNFIDDPGIVRIFDLGELADRSLFIMMEYLDGQTLAEQLRAAAGGRLDVLTALRIARQIAAVMAHVHGKGVLHRDLKPDNVVLVADSAIPGKQRIKLIDFGLAKFLDSPERRTSIGMALGTPTYMAPEQCLGSDTLDGRADVYSLGVMFYEMLGGRPPFAGSQKEVMSGHVNGAPPPLRELVPGLPAAVYQLMDELLAKLPTQRPDMVQLEARLTQLETELHKAPAPLMAPAPPVAAARGGRLGMGVAAGALLVLVLDLALWWGARGSIQRAVCPVPPAASAEKGVAAVPLAPVGGVTAPVHGDSAAVKAGDTASASAPDPVDHAAAPTPDEAGHKLHKNLPHKPKQH